MVRLDRFLQHTNLMPSRKYAKSLLDSKQVSVNDKIAKPSTKIKQGDIISLYLDEEIIKVKALIEKKENIIYVGYEIIDRYKRTFASC